MTAIGHEALTQAVLENLQRRHSTHVETVREALPADVAQRLEALEGMAHEVSELSAKLLNLLHTFNSHVHEPPPEMAELARRVQALETLANRRAA
jgi:hypothetical protein